MSPVGVVDEARFGHQVGGVRCRGDAGGEHPLQLLARVPVEGIHAVLEEGPLLVYGEVVEVAVVEDAVGHVVVVPLDHGVADFGEEVQDSLVERDGAFDLVLVEDLKHAPEADPVAVVVAPVGHDVGQGRPVVGGAVEALTEVGFGHEVLELDVGRYPEGDAGVARPTDHGPVDYGRVGGSIRFQQGASLFGELFRWVEGDEYKPAVRGNFD